MAPIKSIPSTGAARFTNWVDHCCVGSNSQTSRASRDGAAGGSGGHNNDGEAIGAAAWRTTGSILLAVRLPSAGDGELEQGREGPPHLLLLLLHLEL